MKQNISFRGCLVTGVVQISAFIDFTVSVHILTIIKAGHRAQLDEMVSFDHSVSFLEGPWCASGLTSLSNYHLEQNIFLL